MQLEVGAILEGKVTGVTNFGVFVELEEGKTGMVHISEVAPTYVNDIRDHVQENQVVKVKVLAIADNGKISLSIKRAMELPPKREPLKPYVAPAVAAPAAPEEAVAAAPEASEEPEAAAPNGSFALSKIINILLSF